MNARMHQLQRALDVAGNTHSLTDILQDISVGQMQSFAQHDSWAVTRLIMCPLKRVVEVFCVVGDDADMPELEDQIRHFAKLESATMIRAMGREGWARRAPERGWKVGPRLYLTEV
jgi:hypothetical protein